MPPPLLLGPAVGHAAAVTFSRQALIGLSDAAIALLLGRLAWRSIPEWIRKDVSMSGLFQQEKDKSAMELTTIASVVEKIQSLFASVSEKLSHGEIRFLRASMLAYIQLAAQLRKLHPADPILTESRSRDLDDFIETVDYASLKEPLDFSIAAYETDTEKLEEMLGETFSVLQHNTLVEGSVVPGHVGHYLAVSEERKILLVGVRGTSSLEDMITDCCGKAVSFSLEERDDSSRIEVRAAQPNTVNITDDGEVEILSGHERIWIEEQKSQDHEYAVRCHEGIMISAKRLANSIQHHIQEFCLKENYQCLLCGHSLGAGVATLTATVLRARFPAIERRLQVVAFAPPPVLDHDSAVASSSYVLSLVNNSDLIPRMSMVNMAVFLEFMRMVSDKLAERGLQPKDAKSTISFVKKLTKPLHATEEQDLLMSHDDVKQALKLARQNVQLRDPDHLFVAGRVLLFVDDNVPFDNQDDESRNDSVSGENCLRCIDTDGCAPMLRHIEIDLVKMISDHVSTSYYKKLESLTKRHASKSSNET